MSTPILVATDFSPLARFAVERAALLARERQCPLRLVHVLNPFAWDHLRGCLPESLRGGDPRNEARLDLDTLAADLAARHGLSDVSGGTAEGRASVQIVEQARKTGAGLVVLGAHGAGIMRDLALGGTAIKVLRASPCPVLVARLDPDRRYARVLAATDFSATATRALRVALNGFPDAAHSIVHAYEVPYEGRMRLVAGTSPEDIERYRDQVRQDAQRKLDAFIADADYQAAGGVRGRVRHGFAAAVLLDELARSNADLLVLGKHGASALDERLLGSVTLNLLHHAPCDVLLVP